VRESGGRERLKDINILQRIHDSKKKIKVRLERRKKERAKNRETDRQTDKQTNS
jgi:hypothetical protein